MENLSQRQNEIVEAIKKIEINFGKDSESRKTRKYLDERIDTLDKLWAEFQSINDKLVNYVDSNDPYFTENYYDKTKKYFESVRVKISSLVASAAKFLPPSLPASTETLSPYPGGSRQLRMELTQTEAHPTTQQAAELLSLQRTRFRAFQRQIYKLKLDDLQDKWEIEDELRDLQSSWKAIDSLHIQIDNILQGSDSHYEAEFYNQEDSYKALKKALNKKLASTAHRQQSTPQIDIPIFTGKYTQWPTFYDLYVESIHNSNLLSNSQKMQHLKGKVRGEAERLIQHLSITSDNYETAWEILTHRYNNPQLLFTKQIEIFLSQPSVVKQTSYEIRRLYDTTTECIHAIQNLGVDTKTWDPILVHLISKKLDSDTYSDYKEARKAPRELPTLSELMTFLEAKFTALEPIIFKKERDAAPTSSSTFYQQKNKPSQIHPSQRQQRYNNYQVTATYTWNCPLCKNKHVLYKCNKFNKLTADEKLRAVTNLGICKNCLYVHEDNICNSTRVCKICKCDHNTVLHDAITNDVTPSRRNPRTPDNVTGAAAAATSSQDMRTFIPTQNSRQHNVNHVATDDEEILLTTLSIKVKDNNGQYVTLRGLLDQGSQISLISEGAAQLLGLARQSYHASVSGIGIGAKQSKGVVTLDCMSIYQDHCFTTQALVINRVINNLPNTTFKKQQWLHLNYIKLADPDYNISKPIDLLLDASVYSDIIMNGLIKGPSTAPIAQQTKLGWILSGNVRTFNCHVVLNNITDLAQYWELEDIQETSHSLTKEEQYCEDLYKQTTRRLPDGRYEVAIPMKPNYEEKLGGSKSKAIAQFHNLENKMKNNEVLYNSYKQFMNEYESMKHMKLVNCHSQTSCYLPHHGVLKLDSTTTKLRTVFNASSKTSTGYTLNDLMERGPNLQQDLHSLILVWRKHKYVITADIEKMFRQVLIRECDQHLQRIVWRYSPKEAIKDYQLTTVTYGTKAAPYLAMRTLKQLAIDDANKYPRASTSLMSSFYMDDLLEGDSTIENAKIKQQEIIAMLKGAGMNIRKWSSNTPELTKGLSAEQLDSPLDFKCSETKKTLGLRWNPSSDTFVFQNKFQDEDVNRRLTKRQLLSNISKVFDPLGWLSPITIRAKLLFQLSWTQDTLGWDDQITDEMNKEWLQLLQDFQNLDQFKIPRYLGDKGQIEIHGFCDASEKAYACAIYIVMKQNKGEYTSAKLITAKTKLAPVKNKLSLPRLELCGALLLSRLMKKVLETFSKNTTVYAWTDSTVVLGWICGDIKRWKQFVANRVQTIVQSIPSTHWHHVRSEDNAADCATRGLTTVQLSTFSLWWEGPQWIRHLEPDRLMKKSYDAPTIETKRVNVNAALKCKRDLIITILNKYSSIRRVATTIAWLARFAAWLRDKQTTHRGYLTHTEIEYAYSLIIKTEQSTYFYEEINQLNNGKELNKNSKLLCLNPYIDNRDGFLRVGGRLNNSTLSPSAKHPIILPSSSRLTELLIQQAHAITYHGGPRLTLSYLREKYWILSGLRTVKQEVRKCVLCRRYSVEKTSQMMADLPQPRVTPSRPFTHTGVDFTGHFEVKANKGRGIKTLKSYVAVFVCLATKAVHLELVSDLSTQGFLAAFRRFCARRGTPSHMYSDNGTNFVGANRLLKKEYQEILKTINEDLLYMIKDLQIKWRFNAPAFPSAGGLWEAAVKSFKYHLRRVMGEQKLTYEEFVTLLHQIEACLNSRPLTSITENPDDEYLTPGHFLVGGSLLSRPQTEPDHMSLTTRWKLIQNMNKNFWRKWSSEYLQSLQSRSKWRKPTPNIQKEDIVLLKDDNLPPGKWALGRVIDTHPGKDGHVRIVTVKTKNGILKRPILKLCLLPTKENDLNPRQDNRNIQSTNSTTNDATTTGDRNMRQTRRIKGPAGNFLSFVTLLCLTFVGTTNAMANVTRLRGSQDIYYDKLYEMSLIRDEWKLVTYYNMTTYWLGINTAEEYVSHFSQYLYRSTVPNQYRGIIHQLQNELMEIQHYNMILMPKKINVKRPKRGLVNGVGYLANSLFGVLDERFVTRYEQDIEKIAGNENHLQQLLKNQTSVIEAESNILHRNEAIMNKQFKNLHQHLEDLSLVENRIQADLNSEIYALSSLLAADMVVSSIRNIQQNLISTITDLTHGHIDAHFLPPSQLKEQINIIYSNLPNDLTLPVDKENLEDLYKIMKTSVQTGTSFLIIESKIPLISKDSFQLDHLIPLPHNNHILEPTTRYIAFNLPKDLLLLLTESEVQSCYHKSSSHILCSLDKPVYELKLTESICRLKLNNISFCRAKQSACTEQWIKLHNNNRWLFTCCQECSVRIFCADGIQMMTLTGNGLIDMGQGCSIRSDTYSITVHNNYLSHIFIQNDIPMVPETSILNHIMNKTTIEEFSPEDHEEKWQKLKNDIEIIKRQSDITPLTVHDVHQFTILYTIVIVIILSLTGYSIAKYRRRCVARREQLGVLPTRTSTVTFVAPPKAQAGEQPPSLPATTRRSKNTMEAPATFTDAPSRTVRVKVPSVSESD